MGIYDRDYYRGSGPSLLGSISDRGSVCKWLIFLNILCFVIQLFAQGRLGRNDRFTQLFSLNSGVAYTQADRLAQLEFPDEYVEAPERTTAKVREEIGAGVLQGQVWRLLTYAFLHGDLYHILFNMLFLWWFGSDLEELYGSREFLTLYLVTAVLGGVAYVVAQAAGLIHGLGPCIGASGAVTGIMVLSALHYPDRIILLFLLVPVPIWLFVLFQVGKDVYTFLSNTPTQTAVTVHLAGAAFAFAYYKQSWRLSPLWLNLGQWSRSWSKPRLRVYREEPSETVPVAAVPPGADVDEQLEAKLDAVLEKVARFGQASLTENERQILLRASEVYKRRRT